MHGMRILICLSVWIQICAHGDMAIFNSDRWIPISEASDIQTMPIAKLDVDLATLFVGIAHYRDRRCSATLKNLFTKAKYPQRLRVGVVQHLHTEDDTMDCIKDYCVLMGFGGNRFDNCPHVHQIKTIVLSFLDSRGPNHARFMQQSMMQNEEFCLQIDSHSDVIQGWDEKLITMWQSTGNEYAVLSTRAPDISSLSKATTEVPHICEARFTETGMLRTLQPRSARALTLPILAPLWAAGFSFSKCHAETKVPYDPHLPFLFDGEEFSRFARLWTKGYDVYTPSAVIVAHDYSGAMLASLPATLGMPLNNGGKNNKAIETADWHRHAMSPEYSRQVFDDSVARVATLLGLPQGKKDPISVSLLTKYGLGDKRSLDQLAEFTGIDLKKKVVFADRCKQLAWVPYTFDNESYVETGNIWGLAPEVLVSGAGRHSDLPLGAGAVEIVYANSATQQKLSLLSVSTSKQRAIGDGISNDMSNNKVSVSGNVNHLRADLPLSLVLSSTDATVGELWWIFQFIDQAVEKFISKVDRDVGEIGHGHRVMKVMLLVLPVMVGIVCLAAWVIVGGIGGLNKGVNIVRSQAKII